MATEIAAPKSTGGGGFTFEDDVSAWLLAAMLVGEPVFGPGYGVPVQVDFQVRPDGWFLDDVLVTTALEALRHRFALSVKSSAQFTAKSAPSDFVTTAWEQWHHIGSTVFDPDRDFMGLITSPLSGAAASALAGLAEKARVADASRFPSRLAKEKWATEDQRSLFTSFACPASLDLAMTDVDTARLLQRLRFIQRDFDSIASESQNSALELCRRATTNHTSADALALWTILRGIARDLRPKAGSLTLHGLVHLLRARVLLAEYPDHAADWERLDARSKGEAALVRDSIAGRISLPREAEVSGITDALRGKAEVALLGPSGVGKSALGRAVFEARCAKGERTLWVDALALDCADFGTFEASLLLRHSFTELLGNETGPDPLIVIDGLDRLYSEHSFRSVATLIGMLTREPPITKWRVLAVCQSQEWGRVADSLQRAGALERWFVHQVEAPQLIDLRVVQTDVPALRRLLLHPRVGKLLTNLKLLDLVVRRLDAGAVIDPSKWLGESSVAEWFWEAEVNRGQDRLARGWVARAVAQSQADDLVASVSVDGFEVGALAAAQSLIADSLVVRVPGDRLAFAHDLYADWARLRILLNHRTDLPAFLRARHDSPLWHRAIRLLGIHLLEHEDGVEEWKSQMTKFDGGEMIVVRDLLLEAPAFAMSAGALLDSIFPHLVAGDGVLLRRLLTRFLAFATVPNEGMLEIAHSIGMDQNAARATYRLPHWPYWLDVLTVLHNHRDDALRVAASEAAKLVEMWLDFVPAGGIRRQEVAELALMLGQRALDTRDVYSRGGQEDRKRFYKCALLAAPERPDEVAELARVAAERVARPVVEADEEMPTTAFSVLGPGTARGPWPDGPLARVDDEFRTVVLDTLSIQSLYQERPSIAREVILATVIKDPYVVYWGASGLMRQRQLDFVSRPGWRRDRQGPFLACLRNNFAEGLELVMQIVEFATERTKESDIGRVGAIPDGHREVGRTLSTAAPKVRLHTGTRVLTFEGDANLYRWCFGGGTIPDVVKASLMALEQYFCDCLNTGKDIAQSVNTVLDRTESVAVLGLLCELGKRQPPLFDGPLRPLLSDPELYSRKPELRDIAAERLFNSEEMRSFFTQVRTWWRERRLAGEQLPEITGQLDLLLEPTNYEQREHPSHGRVFVNVALERMQSANTAEQNEMRERMSAMIFPSRCRKILDESESQPTNEQLAELWSEWSRLRELAEDEFNVSPSKEGFERFYIDGITGGIAVFLSHQDWLADDEGRVREIESAVEALEAEIRTEETWIGSAQDASTLTSDCFVVEAAAMLWAREPQDPRWRRLVAQAVFSEKYVALSLLFSQCALHRGALGEDFDRLRRVACLWAHVRDRVAVLRSWHDRLQAGEEQTYERLCREVDAWHEEIVESFVDSTLVPIDTDWDQFDAGRFAEIDEVRRRWPGSRVMDFHVVRCSHDWLPLPDDALSPTERAGIIAFWQVALHVVTARPRADLEKRDQERPNEDERWVLDQVAAVVLQLRSDENSEQLWRPIVDLHSEAHDWAEIFLNSLHLCALEAAQVPLTYGAIVRQVASRAFSDVEGADRWPWHEEVWDALLGLDGYAARAWADRHAAHVAEIWDVVSLWMEKAPQESRRLGRFARWLSGPAAKTVRLRTLEWFLEATAEKGLHRPEFAEDDVARLLNVVWDCDLTLLRSTPGAFTAFRGLLRWLAGRQNTLGLELQGRIGGLG